MGSCVHIGCPAHVRAPRVSSFEVGICPWAHHLRSVPTCIPKRSLASLLNWTLFVTGRAILVVSWKRVSAQNSHASSRWLASPAIEMLRDTYIQENNLPLGRKMTHTYIQGNNFPLGRQMTHFFHSFSLFCLFLRRSLTTSASWLTQSNAM